MKNNTIGKRIAEARINRNITQEHLEELSGLSVSTISRIETGKYMLLGVLLCVYLCKWSSMLIAKLVRRITGRKRERLER